MYKFSDFIEWDEESPYKAFNVSLEFFERLTSLFTETTESFTRREIIEDFIKRVDEELEINSVNELVFTMYIAIEAASYHVDSMKTFKHTNFLNIIESVYKKIT